MILYEKQNYMKYVFLIACKIFFALYLQSKGSFLLRVPIVLGQEYFYCFTILKFFFLF